MLNCKNEVNAITSIYAVKIDFATRTSSISAQKIDGLVMKIYGMIRTEFSIYDKLGRTWFFDKTFLLTNTNIKIVLDMLFLSHSNPNLQFGARKFTWKIYTTTKIMFTTMQVELIDKHKFVRIVLDKLFETFVIYVTILEVSTGMTIHSFHVA